MKHLRGRDLGFHSRISTAPKRQEPFLTSATHCSHFDVFPAPPLCLRPDSTHHSFQTETGSGFGTSKSGIAATFRAPSRVPRSLSCVLPIHSSPAVLRTREIMSNMESILSVCPGDTRALWAGGWRRQGAGDTPRGLTFLVLVWSEGALARMGRLQQPGLAPFIPSLRCCCCCRRHPRMWGGSGQPVDRQR